MTPRRSLIGAFLVTLALVFAATVFAVRDYPRVRFLPPLLAAQSALLVSLATAWFALGSGWLAPRIVLPVVACGVASLAIGDATMTAALLCQLVVTAVVLAWQRFQGHRLVDLKAVVEPEPPTEAVRWQLQLVDLLAATAALAGLTALAREAATCQDFAWGVVLGTELGLSAIVCMLSVWSRNLFPGPLLALGLAVFGFVSISSSLAQNGPQYVMTQGFKLTLGFHFLFSLGASMIWRACGYRVVDETLTILKASRS